MNFYMTDLFVRMPLFGLISRNAKNFEPGERGWMNAESKLCTEYKKFFDQISEKDFLQRIEYMKAANDLGRTPMGWPHKVFLFLLIAAEAAGFSFLLGAWMARDASANTLNYLMYGIVGVLASILAIVTHYAGEQFYRTRLKRACFARYKESKITDSHTTRPIALSDDQFQDAHDLPARRTLNRIAESDRDMGSYSWCWVAAIFVLCIFAGSAYMRVQHLHTELTHESAASSADAGNPFRAGSSAPAELSKPQQAADEKARGEELSYQTSEGVAAILILSVIFVMTQVVGFSAGYKHCFAGRQTYVPAAGTSRFWFWKEWSGAYADTWGFAAYQQYWRALGPAKATVNKRLKDLQHRLIENSPVNLTLSKTFEDFLAEDAAREQQQRRELNSIMNQAHPLPDSRGSSPVPAHGTSEAAAAAQALAQSLDRAKTEIAALADKEAQVDYFESLSLELQQALRPWLLEQKKKAAARREELRNELF